MILRFGNLTMKQFAEQVDADFTPEELDYLESQRTDLANFSDTTAFHISDDPAISVALGAEALGGRVAETFIAANERKTFNRVVGFYLANEATS